MLIADHAAIIGGGFSGTLLAINLLRHGSGHVTLIERNADQLARGLAFGAAETGHVLNVRAANMSAFPDRPDHFSAWLEQKGLGSKDSFATRQTYGAYLRELLDDVRETKGKRLSILGDDAIDLTPNGQGWRLHLASGTSFEADAVVVASGNLPPHDLPAFADLQPPAYFSDPWAGEIADGLTEKDTVLLLGTGLTAVDCILTLQDAGFDGRIVALSRRGLPPQRHAAAAAFEPINERPPVFGSALIQAVRERSALVGWRNAIDELRPFTQDIWRAASQGERARFLHHLRPFWDIHRHRIAPVIADQLDALSQTGRLEIRAGKITDATQAADGLHLQWRPRNDHAIQTRVVQRVINCTGPLGDLKRTHDPLLASLRTKGLIRPDMLAIGIDVDRLGRAIAGDGQSAARLFIVGPMTRGAHWEIVAVPDIRKQVWSLARYLTAAYWVEGEGL